MQPQIIIDGNFSLHKNFHVFKKFQKNGLFTGTVYGLLKDVIALSKGFNTKDIHVTWDSRSFRKDINSDYKANRKTEGELNPYTNQSMVFESLRYAGVKQYKSEGLESDDLINLLAQSFSSRQIKNVVYTKDRDLLQTLSPFTSVIKDIHGPEYTMEDFEKEYGFPFSAQNFIFWKSVLGDGSDNIKGILRFRKADLAEYIRTGTTKEKSLLSLKENQQLIESNKSLVTLVSEGDVSPIWDEPFQEDKIREILEATGIRSLKNEIMHLK